MQTKRFITVAVSEQLLAKAKATAREEETSLSALVRRGLRAQLPEPSDQRQRVAPKVRATAKSEGIDPRQGAEAST
jgi:hypothetical protein